MAKFVPVPDYLARSSRQMRMAPTRAERVLWCALRDEALGPRFRRQVQRGPYIVDFACLSQQLVIEVDGDQHADSEADRQRDAWLRAEGYCVLRFSNREVLNELEGVLAAIQAVLESGGEVVVQAAASELVESSI